VAGARRRDAPTGGEQSLLGAFVTTAGGDPAMIRPRDSGAARSVCDAYDWVTSHRAELATYLR
jgi:hypothetical protein